MEHDALYTLTMVAYALHTLRYSLMRPRALQVEHVRLCALHIDNGILCALYVAVLPHELMRSWVSRLVHSGWHLCCIVQCNKSLQSRIFRNSAIHALLKLPAAELHVLEAAQESHHPEVRPIIGTARGERRLNLRLHALWRAHHQYGETLQPRSGWVLTPLKRRRH